MLLQWESNSGSLKEGHSVDVCLHIVDAYLDID